METLDERLARMLSALQSQLDLLSLRLELDKERCNAVSADGAIVKSWSKQEVLEGVAGL